MADAGAPASTQLRNEIQKEEDTLSQIPTQQIENHSPSSSTTAGVPHSRARQWEYGPLSRIETSGERLPAFGGDFQPGLYKPPSRNFANPAPLGLAGFALTTFVLSLINLQTRDVTDAAIVIGPAFAYGGLCQLLGGMWEFPNGNTFGGWALSSYGGFWISIGIILTPGGFDIVGSYPSPSEFYVAFGLYIFGWFIFTFIVWMMTLKSTVAFSSLFFMVWMAFIFLGCAYIYNVDGVPVKSLQQAGGAFGIVAAFIAWWNMLAGIADTSNSLFLIPVIHFPWSEKGRAARRKSKDEEEKIE
ncbi:hypothetical protein MBLNU457_1865t1 [Dothideomycetes sp. NU457]